MQVKAEFSNTKKFVKLILFPFFTFKQLSWLLLQNKSYFVDKKIILRSIANYYLNAKPQYESFKNTFFKR